MCIINQHVFFSTCLILFHCYEVIMLYNLFFLIRNKEGRGFYLYWTCSSSPLTFLVCEGKWPSCLSFFVLLAIHPHFQTVPFLVWTTGHFFHSLSTSLSCVRKLRNDALALSVQFNLVQITLHVRYYTWQFNIILGLSYLHQRWTFFSSFPFAYFCIHF